jgi:hypothetical protein
MAIGDQDKWRWLIIPFNLYKRQLLYLYLIQIKFDLFIRYSESYNLAFQPDQATIGGGETARKKSEAIWPLTEAGNMAATEEKAAKYRQFFQQTTFYFDSAEGKLLGAFIEKFGGVRSLASMLIFNLNQSYPLSTPLQTLAPFFSNKVKCVVTSLSPNAISHLKSQVKQSPAPNTPYQHNHSPAASWDIASQK